MEARSCAVFCQEKSYIWNERKRAGMNEVFMTPTIFLSLDYTRKNAISTIFSQYILNDRLLLTVTGKKVV